MSSHPAPTIIVHGGVGRIRENASAYLLACRDGARRGWQRLQQGASALDAVQSAVETLENNPLFNAGTGSALNRCGHVQMDASLMEGHTLRCGAVAAVTKVKNPIAVARAVLEDGEHVLLCGDGALEFARHNALTLCAEDALVVPRQRSRWERKYGTVGCVAVDNEGRTAAATSTGGIMGALPGRIGDSALIGCGTCANEHGAVSCTGLGEAIIRTGLARMALEIMRTTFDPAAVVNEALVDFYRHTDAEAGLIMVDHQGRMGWAHNTPHMPVCVITGDGSYSEHL
ncbi:MAG TPA: peptidase T [Gammaproteobacteria bacterium]|nr:peptidase T [Gammaproteobacteria bacterium]